MLTRVGRGAEGHMTAGRREVAAWTSPEDDPLMNHIAQRSIRRGAWALLLAAAFAVAVGCAPNEKFASTVVSAPAPDFTLQTGNNIPVSLHDLRGEVVVVYFGYTHCPDVCPMTMSTYARALEQMPESMRQRVKVVMVSVDPKRDTPEIMAKYVAHFSPNFVGVTGSEEQINTVTKAWDITVECGEPSADGSYVVGHPAHSYVLDKLGRQRLIVPHDISAETLAADLELLLRKG